MTKRILLSTFATAAILSTNANAGVEEKLLELEKIILKQQEEIKKLKEQVTSVKKSRFRDNGRGYRGS